MKQIINLLNLAIAFASVFYTVYYMDSGDVCKTIVGCTMMLMWFYRIRREK